MKKLLIVDDDIATLLLLSTAFEHEFLITEATNGVQAIQSVLADRPDIIIVDGKMPRLDGLSVVGAVKSDPKLASILVVMLSGRSDFSDLERGITAGADAYFIKPINMASIRNWITKNPKLEEHADQVPALADSPISDTLLSPSSAF